MSNLNKKVLYTLSLEEIHHKDEIEADIAGAEAMFKSAMNYYTMQIGRLNKQDQKWWSNISKACGYQEGNRNIKLRMTSINNQMVIILDKEPEEEKEE
jgi:hypothetical protein